MEGIDHPTRMCRPAPLPSIVPAWIAPGVLVVGRNGLVVLMAAASDRTGTSHPLTGLGTRQWRRRYRDRLRAAFARTCRRVRARDRFRARRVAVEHGAIRAPAFPRHDFSLTHIPTPWRARLAFVLGAAGCAEPRLRLRRYQWRRWYRHQFDPRLLLRGCARAVLVRDVALRVAALVHRCRRCRGHRRGQCARADPTHDPPADGCPSDCVHADLRCRAGMLAHASMDRDGGTAPGCVGKRRDGTLHGSSIRPLHTG